MKSKAHPPKPAEREGQTVALNKAGDALSFNAKDASQLLDEFRAGQYDLGRIIEFFVAHPALEAQVVKRANSVIFHRSSRTTTLRDAVLRLGLFELYDIVFNELSKYQRGLPATING